MLNDSEKIETYLVFSHQNNKAVTNLFKALITEFLFRLLNKKIARKKCILLVSYIFF